jgi:hypothetical protein
VRGESALRTGHLTIVPLPEGRCGLASHVDGGAKVWLA